MARYSSACACWRTSSSARGFRTPTPTCSRSPPCWRASGSSRSTGSAPSSETGDILVRPRLRPLPYQRQLLLWGIPVALTLLGVAVLALGVAGSVLLGVFLISFAAVIRDRPSPKHFGPLLLVWGLAMFMLIFIRDLGSSLMFFGGALVLSRSVAHVQERVDIWLDPFADNVVDDEGYQLAQSLFAQADGGLFGQGFGQALLELPGGTTILPAAHTDLIYAVLANEAGLFGAAGLL